MGSFTQSNTAGHSEVVDTRGHIKGHSYERTNVTYQGSSSPKHNVTVGAHKQLKQLGPPTAHTYNHKGSNHDTNQFDISLCNRFESLAYLQEDHNLQLQSYLEQVISCAGGTKENASERIQ